jgi:probable addiction module antidote protein
MPGPNVRTEPYRKGLLERIQDPELAALYLSECLEDDDPQAFLLALRDVADASGGVRALSETAHLNRESLYRMLSEKGQSFFGHLVGGP